MQRCWLLLIITMLLLVALTACQTKSQMSLRDGFGNAVKSNVAMHIIDPEAGKQEPVVPDLDGQKAEQGLETYRTDTGEAETGGIVEDLGGSSNSSN